ncbi:MAG TPA: hypothetical protein VH877_22350 [Polyangia bacterium]|jgi:hypothetical protein|nr:hypothetical protein [Polyangia bacterium]
MAIDLTQYLDPRTSLGTWKDELKTLDGLSREDRYGPNQFILRWQNDTIGLFGPLRINVSFYTENGTIGSAALSEGLDVPSGMTSLAGGAGTGSPGVLTLLGNGGSTANSSSTPATGLPLNAVTSVSMSPSKIVAHLVYSYVLDIPPGQRWLYRMNTVSVSAANVLGLLGANLLGRHRELAGIRVVITPAAPDVAAGPVMTSADLPCDFAAANIQDLGQFFPAGCEPCPPGVPTALPPGAVSTLTVPVAPGGCKRTRFFNGMFITREDLETEQRYFRLKNRLYNRADGQGVVWGLNVARAGESICVYPGYAVDCCGNDLTLSALYRVDPGQLILDPAASATLARPGRHRMHLLLEYVECPEEPRPVHGDACTNDVTRCEMSRVRESVRLRLVPPRDFDPSNPITGFLNAAAAIAKPDASRAGQLNVPFQLLLVVNYTFTPRDSSAATKGQAYADRVPEREADGLITGVPQTVKNDSGTFTFEPMLVIVPESIWVLVGGSVTDHNGEKLATARAPFTQHLEWKLPAPRFDESYSFEAWQAQTLFAAADDEVRTGKATIKTTSDLRQHPSRLPWIGRFEEEHKVKIGDAWTPLQVKWGSGEVSLAPTGVGPMPCKDEPCCPPTRSRRFISSVGRITAEASDLAAERVVEVERLPPQERREAAEACPPRFPVMPPWLDEDPRKPGSAGDPKALVLAALYGWLSQELARHQAGTPNEIFTTRRQVASLIYRGAADVLFGAQDDTKRAELSTALRDLMSAWCQSLIYPGPTCAGEPHGVVIGCATVSAGIIQSVDPWGGRRWAMHYPLIAYWGQQFGVAPPDLTASRLFSLVCCISALPVPHVADALPRVDLLVPLGQGFLALGDEQEAIEQLEVRGYQVERATSATKFEKLLGRLLADLIAGVSRETQPDMLKQYRLSGGISLFSPQAARTVLPINR